MCRGQRGLSLGRGYSAHRDRRRIETAGRKVEYGLNLLPRHMVLFDDFLDARTQFETFKHRSDRHSEHGWQFHVANAGAGCSSTLAEVASTS